MNDNHLTQQPDVLLFDQDDDALLIGVKVSKSWLRNQPRTFHDALLAMLAQMTLPPPIG